MVRIAEDVVEGGGGAALAPAPLPRNLRQLASRLLHAFRFIPCHFTVAAVYFEWCTVLCVSTQKLLIADSDPDPFQKQRC